jgi:catechol 2,3-dioxygenase-like lactoylglutathione lyase family enzyme
VSMFTHVTVGTNDPDRARQFYDAVFEVLGIPGQHTPKGAVYFNPDPAAATGMFGVVTPRNEEPACFANGGTVGFKAESTAQVDAWYAAGMANGGSDEGPPGPREFGMPIYAAYMRDPDGNKLCALVMTGEPDAAS